jgi:hypothetical protein
VSAVNLDLWIDAGNYYTISSAAGEGWTIEGDFEVTSGNDIAFFICDADNLDRWSNGQSSVGYEVRDRTTFYEFEFEVPYEDTWYVVLSNHYSFFTSKHVEGTVNFIGPAAALSSNPFVVTGLIIAGLGFVALILIGLSRAMKMGDAKPSADYPTGVQAAPRSGQALPGTCRFCGKTGISPNAHFCPNCGEPRGEPPSIG